MNIVLTQLRCQASFLNHDLFRVNIVASPSCNKCGSDIENAYHYFFECTYYAQIRVTLLQNLSWLPENCRLDLNLLTSGNTALTVEQNENIFKHVFEYIKKTKRFLLV